MFKAVRRAIKGELQHWGVLKRTGNVKEIVNGIRGKEIQGFPKVS